MKLSLALTLCVLPAAAFAQSPPKPEIAALGAMVQECSGREFQARAQALAAAATIADLQKQVEDLKAKASEKK